MGKEKTKAIWKWALELHVPGRSPDPALAISRHTNSNTHRYKQGQRRTQNIKINVLGLNAHTKSKHMQYMQLGSNRESKSKSKLCSSRLKTQSLLRLVQKWILNRWTNVVALQHSEKESEPADVWKLSTCVVLSNFLGRSPKFELSLKPHLLKKKSTTRFLSLWSFCDCTLIQSISVHLNLITEKVLWHSQSYIKI